MRNRAKCKLCQSVLESFHLHDYVTCKCGEISISGGLDKYQAAAKDFKNFLRVDDENNEIVVKVINKEDEVEDAKNEDLQSPQKIEMKDKLIMLDEMIKNIEQLPERAMTLPITHYDFCSALILIRSLFDEKKEDNASSP